MVFEVEVLARDRTPHSRQFKKLRKVLFHFFYYFTFLFQNIFLTAIIVNKWSNVHLQVCVTTDLYF